MVVVVTVQLACALDYGKYGQLKQKTEKGLTDSFLQLVQSVKHKTVIDCTSVTDWLLLYRPCTTSCLSVQPGDVNGSDSELVHGLRSVSSLYVSEYKTKQSAH